MANGTTPSTLRRLLLLCVCLLAGSGIGFLGQYFTGSTAWFLAVPAAVIVGWFLVAEPDKCLPSGERRSRDGAASE